MIWFFIIVSLKTTVDCSSQNDALTTKTVMVQVQTFSYINTNPSLPSLQTVNKNMNKGTNVNCNQTKESQHEKKKVNCYVCFVMNVLHNNPLRISKII